MRMSLHFSNTCDPLYPLVPAGTADSTAAASASSAVFNSSPLPFIFLLSFTLPSASLSPPLPSSPLQLPSEHCLLLALPCGRDPKDVLAQTKALKTGFITYLLQKQAAGIIDMTVAMVGHCTMEGTLSHMLTEVYIRMAGASV